MKIPDNLVFLQALSHDPYMQWQLEVQITNFRKFGISDKMQVCVWTRKDVDYSSGWRKIKLKYPEVKIYMYEDKGVNLGLYLSQLRPHVLKQHFSTYQDELEDKVFFYHDQDIIFNYLPDFERLLNDDINWQSNTTHYLDYTYLRKKEIQGNIPKHEAIGALAKIGKIPIEIIQLYDGRTGGAQCILKAIDAPFWEDVERMCLEIRRDFWWPILTSINRKYFKSEEEGFQSWCADMWALCFALWNRGKVTDVTSDLDFSWATDSMDTFSKKPIYHNAGALPDRKDIFYKGNYVHTSPLHKKIPLPPENTASRAYVLAIRDVK